MIITIKQNSSKDIIENIKHVEDLLKSIQVNKNKSCLNESIKINFYFLILDNEIEVILKEEVSDELLIKFIKNIDKINHKKQYCHKIDCFALYEFIFNKDEYIPISR